MSSQNSWGGFGSPKETGKYVSYLGENHGTPKFWWDNLGQILYSKSWRSLFQGGHLGSSFFNSGSMKSIPKSWDDLENPPQKGLKNLCLFFEL